MALGMLTGVADAQSAGSPTVIRVAGPEGGPFPTQPVQFSFTNPFSVPIPWAVDQATPWLVFSRERGVLGAGRDTSLSATIDPAVANQLALGEYESAVLYRDPVTQLRRQMVVLKLVVSPAGPELSVTPAEGFTSSGFEGGPFSPATKTYTLTNTGASPMPWSAVASGNWLTTTPSAGTLAPGAQVAVAVGFAPQVGNFPSGSFGGSVTFKNLDGGVGDATRVVQLSIAPSIGQPMTSANRTSGVAPLSVFFDAVGAASGVIQPLGAGSDYGTFHYVWDFGDAASGAWSTNGSARNRAEGYVAAHVFEQPGQYRVRLQVSEPSGLVHEYEQVIDVLDPESVYAGRTYYVSNATGNDSNNGMSPSAPFRSVSRAMSALFGSNGPRRVLFRRGESWNSGGAISVSGRTGPYTIGAYGSGAKPVILAPNGSALFDFTADVSDVRIVDVDLSRGSVTGYGVGVVLGNRSLLMRSRVSAFHTAVGGYDSAHIGNTVYDCELVDNGYYGMYYAPMASLTQAFDAPRHLAILGVRFDNSINNSLLRTYISRSVWQGNTFLRAGQSTARLLGSMPPKKSEFVVVSDNVFDSDMTWVLEVGPQGTTSNQVVENVLIERNRFRAGASVQEILLVWSHKVSVRNNVFDLTNAAWTGAVTVQQRGIGPVPSGVRVDHNTVYRGSWAPGFRFVTATSTDATLVRNNIVFSPVMNGTVAIGTVQAQGNMTANPLFKNAAAGDFRLQPGSPAIDHAVWLPVPTDYFGRSREIGTTFADVGAMEL